MLYIRFAYIVFFRTFASVLEHMVPWNTMNKKRLERINNIPVARCGQQTFGNMVSFWNVLF